MKTLSLSSMAPILGNFILLSLLGTAYSLSLRGLQKGSSKQHAGPVRKVYRAEGRPVDSGLSDVEKVSRSDIHVTRPQPGTGGAALRLYAIYERRRQRADLGERAGRDEFSCANLVTSFRCKLVRSTKNEGACL